MTPLFRLTLQNLCTFKGLPKELLERETYARHFARDTAESIEPLLMTRERLYRALGEIGINDANWKQVSLISRQVYYQHIDYKECDKSNV